MDVELLEDLGTSFGIWTTPTIQFFMNGAKVEELIGANLKKLDEIVFKLKEKAKQKRREVPIDPFLLRRASG